MSVFSMTIKNKSHIVLFGVSYICYNISKKNLHTHKTGTTLQQPTTVTQYLNKNKIIVNINPKMQDYIRIQIFHIPTSGSTPSMVVVLVVKNTEV